MATKHYDREDLILNAEFMAKVHGDQMAMFLASFFPGDANDYAFKYDYIQKACNKWHIKRDYFLPELERGLEVLKSARIIQDFAMNAKDESFTVELIPQAVRLGSRADLEIKEKARLEEDRKREEMEREIRAKIIAEAKVTPPYVPYAETPKDDPKNALVDTAQTETTTKD